MGRNNLASCSERASPGLAQGSRYTPIAVATIGQYLQPTRKNMPVEEYVTPEKFEAYRAYGMSIGFKMVFSGPFVRSSYMADLVNDRAHGETACS